MNLSSIVSFPGADKSLLIDLEREFELMFQEELSSNPIADNNFAEAWIRHLHAIKKTACSYGGYLEDRRALHQGRYMPLNQRVHLGVDINVPAGTNVRCPVPFTVLNILRDPDQNGGWGHRIVVSANGYRFAFGHLRLYSDMFVGPSYASGHVLGYVGSSAENGGWWPHLHIQAFTRMDEGFNFDGYAVASPDLQAIYPEPLALLGVTTTKEQQMNDLLVECTGTIKVLYRTQTPDIILACNELLDKIAAVRKL